MVFFTFPEDARWNNERAAVEFSVLLGEYQGPCASLGGSSSDCSIRACGSPAQRGLKTAVMTAHAFNMRPEKAERHEVWLKPMRPRELIAEVERCIGKSWQWIG